MKKVKLPFTFMMLEVIFTLGATVAYIIGWIVILSGFGWCTTSHKINSTICDARVAAGVCDQVFKEKTKIICFLPGVWHLQLDCIWSRHLPDLPDVQQHTSGVAVINEHVINDLVKKRKCLSVNFRHVQSKQLLCRLSHTNKMTLCMKL